MKPTRSAPPRRASATARLCAARLGLALHLWLVTAWRQKTLQDGEAWVYLSLWTLLRLVWRTTAPTSLWAERVTMENEPADKIETLNGDPPNVDRVATTDPLDVSFGMALFKNLFVDSGLEKGARWVQASSTCPLLHATSVCDQPHPAIRAIDARSNGGMNQLSLRHTRQRKFGNLEGRTRALGEQRRTVDEVVRTRISVGNVRRFGEVAHPLATV